MDQDKVNERGESLGYSFGYKVGIFLRLTFESLFILGLVGILYLALKLTIGL